MRKSGLTLDVDSLHILWQSHVIRFIIHILREPSSEPTQDPSIYDWGEPTVKLQMNRLSLRNDRLKFKTTGKLPIMFEEFIEHTPI